VSATLEERLAAYADVIVQIGVGLRPGQRLQIRAAIVSAPMVRALVVAGYRAGSPLVSVLWEDPEVDLIRLQEAPEGSFDQLEEWRVQARRELLDAGGATVSIRSPDPELMRGADPERVVAFDRLKRERARSVADRVMNNEIPWCVVGAASEGWGRSVFPDADDAVAELWGAIFRAVRVDRPDPVAAWRSHSADLQARAATLTDRRYRALHLRGPGTDLTVGLPATHVWRGGGSKTSSGQSFVPNLPTEEVFTAPQRDGVDGTVSSSRPLNIGGTLVDGFTLTFERGAVVRAEARSGESALHAILDSDDGARRLGELALVPASSPISASGILFRNTLFDENAASHLALGRGYRHSIEGGTTMSREEAHAAGLNDSVTHVDFMIGSTEMDVDGILSNGAREPVMRTGEWSS
jgi:aminopeptidase